METKYLLVLWPESQSFIGVKDCYYVSIDDEEDYDLTLDQAMFVPEDVYERHLLELENTEFDYGHNVNHKVEE